MPRIILMLIAITLSANLFASSSQCSFMGSNTQVALQQTYSLINDLRSLKENTNCHVSERNFTSLNTITKFYNYHLDNSSLENKILLNKEKLETLYAAYSESLDTSYLEKMVTIKTELIEDEALLKITRGIDEEGFKLAAIQNLVGELSNLISDIPNYEACFETDPSRSMSIISGIITLAGSVAGIATLNPLWAVAGNIVGSLVTQLGISIKNYQWKYINELDQGTVFKNMMCMIETQANYYCEKDLEINLIEQLKRLREQGDGHSDTPVWEGFEIQAESIPTLQSWIKNVYYGTKPANPTDAQVQIQIRAQVSSAEGIISMVMAKYKELVEKIDEDGGDRYTLLKNYSLTLSYHMTGFNGGGGNMGMDQPGWIYFKQRFNQSAIPYILVAQPDFARQMKNPPTCSGNTQCNLFEEFLQSQYGSVTEDTLRLAINNLKENLKMIIDTVTVDMESDLLNRREMSASDLLAKSDIREQVYDLTPRQALKKIINYVEGVVESLRDYYSSPEREHSILIGELSNDNCLETLGPIKIRLGCPAVLQVAIEASVVLNDILTILNNGNQPSQERIRALTTLLEFKDKMSLSLVPKYEIILKKDLQVKIETGEISPLENELIHLKRQNLLEQLRREGLENNMSKAQLDRTVAKQTITENLKVFVKITPLKKTIIKYMKSIIDDFNNGILKDLTIFNEGCAILLSLPYGRNQNSTNNSYIRLCQNSIAMGSWNRTRLDLGLPMLPELNVVYDEHFNKDFTDRVCVYNTREKKDTIYGLK